MADPKAKVAVIGSFAVGLTIRAERFPVAGETLLGTDFDIGPGGKGSNQAIGAARLGADTSLIVKIGDDQFGDIALDIYKEEGVSDEYVIRTPDRNTGVGFITLNQAGENFIVLDMGANELLTPEEVATAEGAIAAAQVAMTILEIPVETATAGLRLARQHGVTTILNPAPAPRDGLPDELLAHADVLTPNQTELRILLGLPPGDSIDSLDAARQLQARGVANVVVTRGAKGALLVPAEGQPEEIPGIEVNVVDTTGAGDAFNAALGVALAEGQSLSAAVRFAVVAGALACTRLGVIPALSHRPAVEALL